MKLFGLVVRKVNQLKHSYAPFATWLFVDALNHRAFLKQYI